MSSQHSIIIDSTHVTSNHQLADKLHKVDFNQPAKIFQNKHAVHQFENVTPDVSMPGTPLLTPHRYNGSNQDGISSETSSVGFPSPSLPPTAVHTPPSLSPQHSGDEQTLNNTTKKSSSSDDISSIASSSLDAKGIPHSASVSSLPVRPTTPSQFIFKRPNYNKEYHHTHFHHLEKKDTIFKDLKKLFKGDKHKKRSSKKDSDKKSKTPSVKSSSELSFANEFNRDLEGKYGKWGRFVGKGAGGSVRLIRRTIS
ncbi:hypothetical protein G6F42_022364 [Rhizopus arrhizus]|nr:hypothetical protein G6F42_022364 [Rhizopus arrhizus]